MNDTPANDTPLVFGHRGARAVAPENTKVSFVKALDLGADGVELDVRLTRDGTVVVIHDAALDRTTDGSGLVEESDFASIAELDAGSWFNASFKGIEVPTLDEILKMLAGRTQINVELKAEGAADELVKHVVTEVVRRNAFASVLFSSFHLDALRLLRLLVPDARIGVLFRSGQQQDALTTAVRLGAVNLHAPFDCADEDLRSRTRSAGLQLWVWTANEAADIEKLLDLQVDAIFSDYPDRVVAARLRRRDARR